MPTTTLDAFVSEQVPFARTVARAFWHQTGRRHDLDDLESAALAALPQLVERYDPARGLPWAAYARTRLQHRMIDAVRQWWDLRRPCRAQGPPLRLDLLEDGHLIQDRQAPPWRRQQGIDALR